MTESSYWHEVEAWRRQMDEGLRRRDGWLALAGLFWLEPGRTLVGSSPGSDLVLPGSAPARLGVFEMIEGEVSFRPDPSLSEAVVGAPPVGETLRPDTSGQPHTLRAGEITLALIERGGRLGIRVWDNVRPERLGFSGRRWFPVDPGLRLQADFEPTGPGRTIAVPNVLGDLTEEADLGRAIFDLGGRPHSLRAVPADSGGLWFLFEDRTNGVSTYRAGRFLVAEPPVGGTVVLDFNRAYNPPCAFTPFATCPLPPEGNRLPIAVEAGEQLADGK